MINLARLQKRTEPFAHWVGDDVLDEQITRAINKAWPAANDSHWRIEGGSTVARKASMLFPQTLPEPAQEAALQLLSTKVRAELSELLGMHLLPDPWFKEGPEVPRLGGGLHEIHTGGRLGIHVDFERHPAGLRRVANMLIYLNEDWDASWGGELELHGDRVVTIEPLAGRAVFFRTTPESWHGHPQPLRCPANRARRSLAIYYYAKDDSAGQRATTSYRRSV